MKAVHIADEKRIALLDGSGTAWGELEYSIKGDVMSINHTGVSPEKRGEGLGDLLVLAAIDLARVKEWEVRVICPFASRFIEKNPDLLPGRSK